MFLAQTFVYALEDPNFSEKDVLLFPWLSKHLNILLSRSGKYPPNINKQSTHRTVCFFIQRFEMKLNSAISESKELVPEHL
jgi:hypothetical protein